MTRDLVVDMDSVARLSREMAAVTRSISAIVDTLEAKASTLRAEWSGDAAEAYEVAQRKWTQELAVMTLVLDKLSAVVASTGEKHARREAANAQVWG